MVAKRRKTKCALMSLCKEAFNCLGVFCAVVVVGFGMFRTFGCPLLFRIRLGVVEWGEHGVGDESVGIAMDEQHRAVAFRNLAEW